MMQDDDPRFAILDQVEGIIDPFERGILRWDLGGQLSTERWFGISPIAMKAIQNRRKLLKSPFLEMPHISTCSRPEYVNRSDAPIEEGGYVALHIKGTHKGESSIGIRGNYSELTMRRLYAFLVLCGRADYVTETKNARFNTVSSLPHITTTIALCFESARIPARMRFVKSSQLQGKIQVVFYQADKKSSREIMAARAKINQFVGTRREQA